MKKTVQALGFLMAVIVIVGCIGCDKQSSPTGDKPHISDGPPGLVPAKVSLALGKNMWCGISIIAKNKGFFAEQGLDVDMQYLQSGRYCLDALVSKSTDIANIVEVNVAYFGYTGATNFAVVGNIVSSTSSAIVARKSAGISKPEDIRGKRLAYAPGTTSDIFANRFLTKYGLSEKDVQLLKVQPLAMQTTLIAKGADAVSTWQPMIQSITKGLGEDALVLKDPSIYIGYMSIAVRKDWAAQNRDKVIRFLRANQAAARFMKSNTVEAQQIISKEINLDIETVEATWGEHEFGLTMDVKETLDAVIAIGKWIAQTQEGYDGKPLPAYADAFDTSFYDACVKQK